MRFEALQAVAVAASQERSLKVLLERIVSGVSESGNVALARVWLLGPDRVCDVCQRRPGTHDQLERLHLRASAGRPISAAYRNEDWSRLDGEFHNGGIKIIEVNASEKPTLITIAEDHYWIEKPDWAKNERIKSFAAHPLLFRGLRVGAFGVFSRSLISELSLIGCGFLQLPLRSRSPMPKRSTKSIACVSVSSPRTNTCAMRSGSLLMRDRFWPRVPACGGCSSRSRWWRRRVARNETDHA